MIAFLWLWLQYIGIGLGMALVIALVVAVPVAFLFVVFSLLTERAGLDEDTAGGFCVVILFIVLVAGVAAGINTFGNTPHPPAEAAVQK